MNDNSNVSNHQVNIELSLFLLRLGVFIVMFAWTLDKLTNAEHAAAVFAGFYFINDASATFLMAVGAIEMAIILAFMAGMWKKYTYGAVLLLHAVSTFSSWEQYVKVNLMFFTAIPMLAACVTLYLLRDLDNKYTLGN